ncbi:MAG: PD-(D/E)XK nuclease family protein [Actinomycetota bacterium]
MANTFDPTAKKPFRISRSKIDLFFACPRCFYLDRRLGIARPTGPPFSLNNAVDALLKREFDAYREEGRPHPLMAKHGLAAVPFQHDSLEAWRDALRRGIRHVHAPTNLEVTGGIDDVWQDAEGDLIIVDYKATAKLGEVNLDAPWQDSYKRQVEVYQWLFRKNGFPVSDTAYFVYVNGRLDEPAFDERLVFRTSLLPYDGSDAWVEPALEAIRETLVADAPPMPAETCDHCRYVAGAAGA